MAKRDASIPKNVVRSHLRSYMSTRIAGLINDVKKDANAAIDAVLDPILNTMFKDLAEMERYAQRFVELATDYLAGLPAGRSLPYDMTSSVKNVNTYYAGIRGDKRRDLKRIAAKVIEDPSQDVFVNENQELVDAVRSLQVSMKPFYSKIADLEELREKVFLVIQAAKSGKEAFIKLRDLGIDMMDYRRDETLPAIVHLPKVELLNKKEETE